MPGRTWYTRFILHRNCDRISPTLHTNIMASPNETPLPPTPEPRDLTPETPRDANEFLRGFPDTINKADVLKIEVPGAKHCLVHIRQMHGNPFHTDAENKKHAYEAGDGLPSMAAVQTEIHDILTRLIAKHEMKELYQEGMTGIDVEGLNDTRSLLKTMRELRIQKNEAEESLRETEEMEERLDHELAEEQQQKKKLDPAKTGMLRGLDEKKEELQQKLENIAEREKATKKYLSLTPDIEMELAAALPFVQAGRLEIKAAEDKDVNKQAMEALRRREAGKALPGDQDLIHRAREEALLSIGANEGKTVVYTIYGAAHDFDETVKQWNKDHPDDAYSLIVITPASLQETVARLRQPK